MIPQWLLPPKPELTGTVREPFINQRRQMRMKTLDEVLFRKINRSLNAGRMPRI